MGALYSLRRKGASAALGKILAQAFTPLTCACLIAIMAILLAFQAKVDGRFVYSLWSDRDLVRASNLSEDFPTAGGEMGYGQGARLPGGGQYYLLSIPLLFTDSPVAAHRFILLLNGAACLLLIILTKRYFGVLAGLVAGCIYLLSGVLYGNILYLWNPAFSPLFVIAAYFFFLRVIADRKPAALKWFFASVALAIQMHFSALFLLAPAVVCLAIFAVKDSNAGFKERLQGGAKQSLLCLSAVVVVLSPYIFTELRDGFPNTNLILAQDYLSDDFLSNDYSTVRNNSYIREHVKVTLLHISDFTSLYTQVIQTGSLSMEYLAGVSAAFILLILPVVVMILLAFLWFSGIGVERTLDLTSPQMRTLFFASLTLIIGCLYFMTDINFTDLNDLVWGKRYLLFMLPAVCILCGAGAQIVARELVAKNAGFRLTVLSGVIVLILSVQTYHKARYLESFGKNGQVYGRGIGGLGTVTYDWYHARIGDIRQTTGWNTAEIASKVAILQATPEGIIEGSSCHPLTYQLYLEDKELSGAGSEVGGILIQSALDNLASREIAETYIAQRIAPKLSGFELEEWHEFDRDLFVTYRVERGHVLNTFSNRYLLTSQEKEVKKRYEQIPIDSVERVSRQDGNTAFMANLSDAIFLTVNIEQDGSGTRVALHSNQLRGVAFNKGRFFSIGMLEKPRVTFVHRDSNEVVTTLLDPGQVGGGPFIGFANYGVFTPISIHEPRLLSGTHDVTFTADSISYTNIIHLTHISDPQPVEMPLGMIEILNEGTLTVAMGKRGEEARDGR